MFGATSCVAFFGIMINTKQSCHCKHFVSKALVRHVYPGPAVVLCVHRFYLQQWKFYVQVNYSIKQKLCLHRNTVSSFIKIRLLIQKSHLSENLVPLTFSKSI